MRLLADENIPRPTVQILRSQGHDVLWARTDCAGLKDHALLERAEAQSRLVLMPDKDFWQLALRRPIPLRRCGVILFRVHPAIPETLEPLVVSTLRTPHSWVGYLSIVTRDSIEMISAGGKD